MGGARVAAEAMSDPACVFLAGTASDGGGGGGLDPDAGGAGSSAGLDEECALADEEFQAATRHLHQLEADRAELAMKADFAKARYEEARRERFRFTMKAELAKARSEASNLHLTRISQSPPPTRAVRKASKASLKHQLDAAEEPSPEIEAQMWRDHVFWRDRRIAVLLSVHPRVGQDSRMGTLAGEIMILSTIIEIADPCIDALTARSRAAAVVAENPLRAVLDGPLSASASSTDEERAAEDAVPAANHPRSSPDMIGGGGPAPTVKALTS